ncbi:MAG: hypothetical protein LBQ40_04450 [Clostridiales bacterium]|jgi:hypothetical protein|nr:hypothetical protein [Clostridiales bacterium]
MSVTITYKDIAVGADEDFSADANDKQAFSNVGGIVNLSPKANYGTVGELNNWLLDGSAAIFPDDTVGEDFGFWSASLSNDDGVFPQPIMLTLTADEYIYNSAGITLTFDETNNVFASLVLLRWYNGDTLLSEKAFNPDMPKYFCNNRVNGYNRLEIVFLKLNMPRTFLKVYGVEFGVTRLLKGDEITKTNVINEINPLSTELSVNTFDFTLISKDEIEYVFQRKQALELRFKGVLKGLYFVENYKRTARNKYDVQAVDYIGLLDKTTFYGGMYDDYSAADLMGEIFGAANIPYTLSEEFSGATVTGYLPITTCREALKQVAFAIGAVIDTTDSDKLNVFKLSDTVIHTFGSGEIFQGQNIEQSDPLTEFDLTEHSYTEDGETVTLYKTDGNGIEENIFVEFPEPVKLNPNDAILDSNANYALINATADTILTGKKYTHTTKIVTKKNPLIGSSDLKNIMKIEGATLINSTNSAEVLERCYNYFMKNVTVNNNIIVTDVKVGDTVEVETDYMGVITGVIESLRYNLNGNKIKAEAAIR